MTWHREIWTYLIVTLVAMLIWAWAASETREKQPLHAVSLRFLAANNPSKWTISPADETVQVNVEGPTLAVQEVERLLRQPLQIELQPEVGQQTLDLAAKLREHEEVKATGALVVSTDPERIEVEMDVIDRITAPVKAVAPGVTFEDEPTAQPREVAVLLPHALAERLPADFAVEAFIDRAQLDQLQPGEPQSLHDVRLRLPEAFTAGNGANDVRISPSKVKVNFTIRSRIRETVIDSVRVQVTGPLEDREAYHIEVEPKVLRSVTLLANADLSRQIESGEVPVVAVVYLSSREKEAMIESKPVSYFMALVPEVGGGTRFEPLSLPSGTVMPEINLTITPREQPATE
jgi:hypothetical protein